MPISRMQQPRQMYGLGSFVKKAVKGVTGAVKKIASSDLGKAAGIAALTFGIPGTQFGGLMGRSAGSIFGGAPSIFGKMGIGESLSALGSTLGIGTSDGILKGITKNFPGKGLGLATTVAGLTGFLSAQGKTEEEIEEIKQNPEVLGGYLEQYYRNLNPPTADTNSEEYEAQVSNFVQRNLKANGGRMGFSDGKSGKFLTMQEAAERDPAMFMDTTTSAYGDAGKGRPVPDFLKPQKTLKENLQFLNEIKGGISPKSTAYMLKEYLDNALKNKQITKEKYNKMLMPFFGKTGEGITKQIEAYENFANGGRIGFEDGTYFDEQTTNVTGKETTGPMPGGKTPQIPEEEFLKYQQFKENKVVPASSDSKPEYGTKEYFKQNLDNLELEQYVEKPFLLNPFSIGLIEDRLNSFEKAGGDSSRYRNLYEKIKQENTKYFQSLSEAEQKAYIDRHRKSLEKDIGLGILPGQEELGILDLKKEKGIPQPKKDPFDTEGFKQYRMDAATGGRIGFAFGNPEQNAMEASGIGGLPLNQNPAGITELDLRDNGGFIPPVGVKEKADDIPAMLSNNEFVFTADAVRGMGDGDVNVGAQRMYDMMKKLENGGRV